MLTYSNLLQLANNKPVSRASSGNNYNSETQIVDNNFWLHIPKPLV